MGDEAILQVIVTLASNLPVELTVVLAERRRQRALAIR